MDTGTIAITVDIEESNEQTFFDCIATINAPEISNEAVIMATIHATRSVIFGYLKKTYGITESDVEDVLDTYVENSLKLAKIAIGKVHLTHG